MDKTPYVDHGSECAKISAAVQSEMNRGFSAPETV